MRRDERTRGERFRLRCGQRAAVQLAVGRERPRGHPHIGGGHHEGRQRVRQLRPQRIHRTRLGAAKKLAFVKRAFVKFVVGDQLLAALVVVARHHHDFADVRARGQRRLDLAQLDAVAAHFHLEIVAAEIFQRAVGQRARKVAGAVQAVAGDKRAVDEAFCSQFGAMQVTARHTDATDMNLAGVARRHRPAVGVEQMDAVTVDRASDRDCRCQRLRVAGVHAGPDRGFGGAVGVEHAPARRSARPALHLRRRQRLAGADQHPHRPQRIVGQARQHDRRQGRVGDALARDQRRQGLAGQHVAGRAQVQRGAVAQGHRPLEHAGIEAEGRELQHPAVGRHPKQFALHALQTGQATVGHHHALGTTGGAGRIDDVGQMPGAQADVFQRCGVARRYRPGVAVNHHRRGTGRSRSVFDPQLLERQMFQHQLFQQRTTGRIGQDHGRTCVCQHEGQPLRRIRRIQRHISAAGLQHRQYRFDQSRRTRHADRHQDVRPHPLRAQMARQPVCALIQRAIGRARIAARHCKCIRAPQRLTLESRMRTLSRKLHPDSPCVCRRCKKTPARQCSAVCRTPRDPHPG